MSEESCISLETLIKRFQDGEPDSEANLWNRLEPYYRKKATDFYLRHSVSCTRAGVEIDDLLYYAGYSAMIESARQYNRELGVPAIAYLHYALRVEYAALCGYNKQADALQNAVPLDSPIPNTEDLRLLDILEDEASTDFVIIGDMIEDAEIIHDEVAKTLSDKPKVYGAIVDRYFSGLTLKECARKAGCSPEMIRQREKQAISILQNNPILEALYIERLGTIRKQIGNRLRARNIIYA